jgi:hypothetical protein
MRHIVYPTAVRSTCSLIIMIQFMKHHAHLAVGSSKIWIRRYETVVVDTDHIPSRAAGCIIDTRTWASSLGRVAQPLMSPIPTQRVTGGPAFDVADTNTAGAPSSRPVRGWVAVLPTAPNLTRLGISWYKQHPTRPCKKRKSGAPTVLEPDAKSKGQGRATRPTPASPRFRAGNRHRKTPANPITIRPMNRRCNRHNKAPRGGWPIPSVLDLAYSSRTVGAPSLRFRKGGSDAACIMGFEKKGHLTGRSPVFAQHSLVNVPLSPARGPFPDRAALPPLCFLSLSCHDTSVHPSPS